MKKLLFLFILITAFSASAQKARRLEILFLGDNGHHRPIERVPSIMAALGDKGVNFTYTDKLEDINAANLNKYDALMIYANWDSIPPSVEKDLLAYVASGKGILPIHCASYCFRNSSEYVKMVGGQFWPPRSSIESNRRWRLDGTRCCGNTARRSWSARSWQRLSTTPGSSSIQQKYLANSRRTARVEVEVHRTSRKGLDC